MELEDGQHLVFVYGTLKRGFPNAAYMGDAPLVGLYRTCESYVLVVGGRWFTPYLIDGEDASGHQVTGEAYVVDDEMLSQLDRLESTHLPDGYVRKLVTVEALNGESPTLPEVWCYLKPRETIAIIHDGPHETYQLDARYVPGDLRGERI